LADDISKLLGTPFGIDISSEDVNKFLLDRKDKKLQYRTSRKLNNIGRSIICNGILTSSTMFFLAIWGGLQQGINKLKGKVRNYL
jgi:hypothetical protein